MAYQPNGTADVLLGDMDRAHNEVFTSVIVDGTPPGSASFNSTRLKLVLSGEMPQPKRKTPARLLVRVDFELLQDVPDRQSQVVTRCGGLALVQDPDDAIADEMPRRALEATVADLCIPGAKLGDVLSDLAQQAAGPAVPIPPEILLEVDIAMGERVDSETLNKFADPAALTCPSCGGVLSKVRSGHPLRFRCQVGHAFTADSLAKEQEGRVDEALRVALRIIEERAELVTRMGEEGRQSGRRAVAEMYDERAQEYRRYADTLREAVLRNFEEQPAPEPEPELGAGA